MLRDFSNKQLYNKKYIPILKNKKKYIFLMWWAWSWKSTFEAQKEIIKSYTRWWRLMWVRKVKDTIKDSIYAELTGIISDWWLDDDFEITKSPLYIKNKLTGWDCIFRWMDSPEKIKSVKWVNRVWIEESNELSQEDFDQIDLRLRGKKNIQITCTFNPVDPESWLNNRFWSKWSNKDVECLHSTYLDNRWVTADERYMKTMERLKVDNPKYYEIYALWKWAVMEWLIFNNTEIVEGIPEGANFLWYWKDFWYTNDPTTLVAVYLYDNELYIDELIYKTQLTNQDIVQEYKILWINQSDEIWADCAEPKSIEEIYRAWYNIHPVTKWPDSIKFWIDIMLWYKINITKRSCNAIKEFSRYVWAVDKNWKSINKPIDAWNHIIDAVRYLCMEKLKKQVETTFISFDDI